MLLKLKKSKTDSMTKELNISKERAFEIEAWAYAALRVTDTHTEAFETLAKKCEDINEYTLALWAYASEYQKCKTHAKVSKHAVEVDAETAEKIMKMLGIDD